MTSNQRQTKLRELRAMSGMVPVTVWVHVDQVSDLRTAAKAMLAERDLRPVVLHNAKTGRMKSLQR
jgi:hypothetical protein